MTIVAFMKDDRSAVFVLFIIASILSHASGATPDAVYNSEVLNPYHARKILPFRSVETHKCLLNDALNRTEKSCGQGLCQVENEMVFFRAGGGANALALPATSSGGDSKKR